MKTLPLSFYPSLLLLFALIHTATADRLLDTTLSNFEIWMGIPHASTEGLPPGTFQSTNVTQGIPMGLNADVKNVFQLIEENDELVLHISGEIYGGLTTIKSYQNYHLTLQFRWGEKKWPPRRYALRDSGLLYHCHGPHGAFWNVWKASLEFQVQETDLGDFIPLAGTKASIRHTHLEGIKRARFDPDSTQRTNGYISAWPEPDAPHGKWNQLDLYTWGDFSAHIVNGEVVMVVEKAKNKAGAPLTSGQIQLQSEAAECYYKNIEINPITQLPDSVLTFLKKHNYTIPRESNEP
tara:strand:- start:6123 stop:7004 length:882 start_codon:yes stop_codon:yes gene_type:complete